MNPESIQETLERLKRQVDMATGMVFVTDPHSKEMFQAFESTPNTFVIGDFIVTDKRWTTCGPKEEQ